MGFFYSPPSFLLCDIFYETRKMFAQLQQLNYLNYNNCYQSTSLLTNNCYNATTTTIITITIIIINIKNEKQQPTNVTTLLHTTVKKNL